MTKKTTQENLDVIARHLPNRYWFMASAFIFLLSAFIYLATATDKYKVTGKVTITDNSPAGSVADNIKSRTVVQKVIDQLPLQVSYFHKSTSGNSEIFGDSLPVKIVFNKVNAVDSSAELSLKILDNQQFELRQNDTITQYYFDKPVKYPFATFKGVKGPAFATSAGPITLKFKESDELVEEYYNSLSANTSGDKDVGLSIITTNPQKGIAFLNKLIDVYNASSVNHTTAANIPDIHIVKDDKQAAIQIKDRIYALRSEVVELEKQKKQAAIVSNKLKANSSKLSKTERDLQLKTLDVIQPYVRNSVNQFVQIPYGSEIDNKELSGLVSKFNQVELDKQQDLRDSQANKARIIDFNKQIANLKINISEKITDVKDQIKGIPKKPASSGTSVAQVTSLPDSITKKNVQLKAAMGEYAALSQNKTVQPQSAAISSGVVSTDKPKLTIVEKPGEQIISYPQPWLVYLLALLAALIVPVALSFLKYIKLPANDMVQLKKLQAWIYEMIHPKEID